MNAYVWNSVEAEPDTECALSYGEVTAHTEGPMYLVTVTYSDDREAWWTSACRKCAALMMDFYRPADGVEGIKFDTI